MADGGKRWVHEQMNGFAAFDRTVLILPAEPPRAAERLRRRLQRLGGAEDVRIEPALHTPGDRRVGVLLSHRAALTAAAQQVRSVLVLCGDVLFHDDFHPVVTAAAAELAQRDWGLCHLGGWWPTVPAPEPGCRHLDRVGRVTTVHAVAYSARAMARVLSDWPADVPAAADWIAAQGDIDASLPALAPVFAVHPPVTTVPSLLPFETVDAQPRFAA
jgi:hypothetical protein